MSKNKVIKFWNMASVSGDEAEITLYGDICSFHPVDWWTGQPLPGLFITPEGFLEDLEKIKNKSKITVKINSCGGDLYTGISIHNALKGLTGHKTVIVEGIAVSAASVIMCAGDEVQVYPGSTIMIHGVSGLLRAYMTIADLELAKKAFEAAEKAIAEIYNAKTGIETDKLRSMMAEETWLVGNEAVENNFADTLLSEGEPEMSISTDNKVLLVAGVRHDIKDFKNIPEGFKARCALINIDNKKGEESTMKVETVEQLKAEYPELTSEIINAAVLDERKRIQDIENITLDGYSGIVNKAKFEEPKAAADVALIILAEQKKQGGSFLNALNQDFWDSGAADVSATPNTGNLDHETNEAVEIMSAVNLVNSMKKGGNRK